MQYISGQLQDISFPDSKALSLTIGNFDGLHKGHRKLIETVKDLAEKNGFSSAVLSFYPHPATVLKDEGFQLLTSPEEKRMLLSQVGLDYTIEYCFDRQLADMDPTQFVEEYLFNRLRCRALVIGEGYRFGHKRQGDFALLQALGRRHGVQVDSIPHEELDGRKISSSEIKSLIMEHRLEEARQCLTLSYFVMGQVMHGKKLGRGIGFPTVNLTPDPQKLLPPHGIYVTQTTHEGHMYNSITNIGSNPTFGGKAVTIETFIFDFYKDIYGQEIKVDFLDFVRGEVRFDGPEALKAQIQRDIQKAKEYFS